MSLCDEPEDRYTQLPFTFSLRCDDPDLEALRRDYDGLDIHGDVVNEDRCWATWMARTIVRKDNGVHARCYGEEVPVVYSPEAVAQADGSWRPTPGRCWDRRYAWIRGIDIPDRCHAPAIPRGRLPRYDD